jgi:hypothetical protein
MAYPYDNGQTPGGLLGMWGGQPAPKNMSMADVVSGNPGFLAGVTALSMLANNNGRRSFGQLLGRGGLDALGALGNAGMYGLQRDRVAAQDALARAQWEASREDRGLANAISLGNLQLNQQRLGIAQQKAQREAADRDMWGRLMGLPGLTGGSGQGADMDPLKIPRIPDGPTMPASTLPPKSQRPAGPDGAPLDKAAITNNPGNVGNYEDQIRVYPTILDGLKGMRANLLSPAYAKNPTVAAIISRWSPSNENDTSALIKDTAAMMGVDPNQPLNLNDPQTMKRLMQAITKNEGSYKYVPADEFDMAVGLKPVPAGYKSVDYRGGQQAQGATGTPYSGGTGGVSPNIMAAASLPGDYGAAAGRVAGLQQQQEKNALDREKFDFERAKASPGYMFNQKLAEKSADFYDSLISDVSAKNDMITNVETLKSLLPNLKSGPLQDKIDLVNQFLHKIGFSGNFIGANDVRDADALNYLVNKNVLNVLMEQKGVQTEGDAERAKKTFASLENSPAGNDWMANYMLNIATRGKEMDLFLLDQMRKNGGDRFAAMQAWEKYSKTLPSVVPPAPERVTRTNANPAAAAPSGGRHYRYDPATKKLLEN